MSGNIITNFRAKLHHYKKIYVVSIFGYTPKKFKDKELEKLLNQGTCQTQTEFAELLGVDQSTVSNHLNLLRMIQKQRNWGPYELKPRFFRCDCVNHKNVKVSCTV